MKPQTGADTLWWLGEEIRQIIFQRSGAIELWRLPQGYF